LRERQLSQADLIVDLQESRLECDLDRSIHPLVGNIVSACRTPDQGGPRKSEKNTRDSAAVVNEHGDSGDQL
jgi:hypothetical protein